MLRYNAIMIRTQIQFTEDQVGRLRTLAHQRGVSISEVVRQAVDMLVRAGGDHGLQDRRARALEAVGSFSSGRTDISTNHDQYLEEPFGDLR